MSEWISVKDRLPEKGKRVLCFTKYNHMVVDAYDITVGPPDEGNHWFLGDSEEYNIDVTHWQPLPEPPSK